MAGPWPWAELATAARLTSWSPAGRARSQLTPLLPPSSQKFKYPKPGPVASAGSSARGPRVSDAQMSDMGRWCWVSVSVTQSVLSVSEFSDDSDNNTLTLITD